MWQAVQATCGYNMKIPNIQQFREEKQKWKDAGSPVRTPEKIAEIFNICSQCEHHIEISSSVYQCGICTCFIRDAGLSANKAAYATTRCPLEEPKWVEESGYEQQVKTQEEQPQQPQYIKRPPRNGGCGCS